MEVLEQNFKESGVFSHFKSLQHLKYIGIKSPKMLCFEAQKNNIPYPISVFNVIHKEEAFVWKSFSDLLERTLKSTAQMLRGFYTFEIIVLEMGSGLQNFDWNQWSQLIVNYSRKIGVGEECLIRYSGIVGVLKKTVEEEWGKIDFSIPVQVFNQEIEKYDLFIKKCIHSSGLKSGLVILHDLGQNPVFRFGMEGQTIRLRSYLEKAKNEFKGLSVTLIQSGKRIDLFEQFSL